MGSARSSQEEGAEKIRISVKKHYLEGFDRWNSCKEVQETRLELGVDRDPC